MPNKYKLIQLQTMQQPLKVSDIYVAIHAYIATLVFIFVEISTYVANSTIAMFMWLRHIVQLYILSCD